MSRVSPVVRIGLAVVAVDLVTKLAAARLVRHTFGPIVPMHNPAFSLGVASAPRMIMLVLAAAALVAASLFARRQIGAPRPSGMGSRVRHRRRGRQSHRSRRVRRGARLLRHPAGRAERRRRCCVRRPDRLRVRDAPADERGVADAHLDPVAITQSRDELVELQRGYVADPAAHIALDVMVRARQMKERRTVRPVHVFGQSPHAQRVEGAIHRREMNLGMRGVNPRSRGLLQSSARWCARAVPPPTAAPL